MLKRFSIFIFCCFLAFEAYSQDSSLRARLNLAGSWSFRLDAADQGLKMNWQDSVFRDEVHLPGSLEENKKGRKVLQASSKYLNQTWQYTGAAWYQKEIDVPTGWDDKQVQLVLERSKVTKVWIDGKLIGGSRLLSAPQVYNLTDKLSAGRRRLTLLVNNSPKLVSVGGAHALSEHTQTNWNGVIGKMYIEASDRLKINWVKVSPDAEKRIASIQLSISNLNAGESRINIGVKAASRNSATVHRPEPGAFKARVGPGETLLNYVYPLGEAALLWDEYHPSLYTLTLSLRSGSKLRDSASVSFGLRDFKAFGTQFSINGATTFLRGKNDGCVFPLTGYPATDTASWRRIFRIARSYGINHYRFHSYTPPEAAFEAADLEGIYIQTELPDWDNLSVRDTFKTNFQYREGLAVLDAYGNHPSFVMLSLGNELAGDSAVHNKLVRDLRKHDARRLYAHGTNAFYADPKPGEADDFWVSMRTGKESPSRESDVRGSFATTEDTGNGLLNSTEPNTRRNFSAALKGHKIPVIGHEVGQFQVYPDFREIPKYTGLLRPANFEIFRKRLQEAGMGSQASDFFKASGQLTAILYREDIEMALRTPGMAGFQLLDLQDYPGQGTALVGLLNAFMESKGIISADEFRSFNRDVVPQLLMDKYVWVNSEVYQADIQLVNYSRDAISGKELKWHIVNDAGKELAAGILPVALAENGRITKLGTIRFPLTDIARASRLTVSLEIPAAASKITYPLWVYPQLLATVATADIVITSNFDEAVEKLNKGEKVLFFPAGEQLTGTTVPAQFISEFWNWQVFKGAAISMKRPVSAGTLGILTDPAHPLFADFPTEFHSNWQWWAITKNARPMILDSCGTGYHPIVQVIDNIDRNHKLGIIFEFQAGRGKLLVSMANLPALSDRPEARQLYQSIIQYMNSDKFNPDQSVSLIRLKQLFSRITN